MNDRYDKGEQREEHDHRPRVAYFCMEYGLESSFRIYAGGLGILAGDYLKAARDMDLPVVGIGIAWKQGYTRQTINTEGRPVDCYPVYQYDFLQDTGVRVSVKIRGRKVVCRVWLVDCFDNAPLYLLDTDLPENCDPWITGQLYGWFGEERIAQEMVLGIGGVRALRALGIETDVYHFNEGHAVFAGLELIREKMEGEKLDFNTAWQETRDQIVFTTHTPVIQGNEEHPHRMLQYMGAGQNLGLEEMVAIGGAPFNMTVAGLRLSSISNGVSRLHSQTASRMWEKVSGRTEIIAVTNGVHRQTWMAEPIDSAWKAGDIGGLAGAHQQLKSGLLEYITEQTGQRLRQDSLLVGFARRAVPYKRGDFIFRLEDKIAPLLREGRLQLVFAGKAHPLDDTGKEIVARQVEYARKYPDSVVFLEDYDMETAAHMTRGCDIWLNNPRRTREACGTSGIKAAMNGVLNLSILDGWWPETCQHGINGWQFGDGLAEDDFQGDHKERIRKQDLHDLNSLYNILFSSVIPIYYDDKKYWIEMMMNSITDTIDQFSARRMLSDYYQKMYDIGEYRIIEF